MDSLRSTRGSWIAVRIVSGIPEVVGWSKDSLRSTRGSWMVEGLSRVYQR